MWLKRGEMNDESGQPRGKKCIFSNTNIYPWLFYRFRLKCSNKSFPRIVNTCTNFFCPIIFDKQGKVKFNY